MSKSFPEKSVFQRKQFDFTTNLVKWVAIRFAFVLYKLGFTANALDVLCMFLVVIALFFLSTASNGNKLLPVAGVLILYFHVFIDFVDGAIAKARGTCSPVGHLLDCFGCDVDRAAMLVLIGIYTGNPYVILANIFAASVLINFVPPARLVLPEKGWIGVASRIWCNKFSLASVRFMLVVLPAFLMLVIVLGGDLKQISCAISAVYIAAAALWLLFMIPEHRIQSSNAEKE